MIFKPISFQDVEREVLSAGVIDFRRRGSHYECTTVDSIRDVCDRNQHCILNVHLESVERLHQNQIYPIVLLIKFKSVKQIKEVKVRKPFPGFRGVFDVRNSFSGSYVER